MPSHPTTRPAHPGSSTVARVWSWRVPRRRLPLIALAAVAPPASSAAQERLKIEPVALLAGVLLPPAPLVVAVGRVSLPPGAAVAATTASGARLLAVEAGTVTVSVVGEGIARPPSGVPPFGPPPSGPRGQMRLRPGATLTAAAEVVREIRNDGAEPAIALDAAVFPGGQRPLAPSVATRDGVAFDLLAGGVAAERPSGPVQLFLRRVMLPPRRMLPRGLAKGIALLYLETGAATLRPIAGRTMTTEETRPPGVAAAGPPMEVGAEAFLLPGGGAFVPHEADADLQAGAGGATLLVLTLHASAAQPLPEVGS